MFKSYLLIAVRNLFKNKLYSLINVAGFAVSMACVVFIVLYVNFELSYDRHWAKADRIYKVMTTFMPTPTYAGIEIATSGSIISVLLEQEFPQVEETVRLVNSNNMVLSHPEDNTLYNEQGVYIADASLADVFDLPLVAGSWDGALTQPGQMVINASLANKYFGRTDVVDQRMLIGGQFPVRISAVMQDLTENTHLAANAFVSMATAVALFGQDYTQSWIRQEFHTYVVLAEDYTGDQFQAEMPEFLRRHASEDPNDNTALTVMPVSDIHLRSNREYELSSNGNIATVYTFSALAVFVLLIACCNFMNLSTARSTTRAREVGMRKTLGASRTQLISQFLGESVLIATLAVLIALVIVEIFLPAYNATIDLDVSMDYLGDPQLWLLLAAFSVTVGLLAGSYPAFFLSSFRSINILRGEYSQGNSGVLFRQFLVVLQFAISIALVIAAFVVLSQMRFANSLDLGFDSDNVLVYRGDGVEGLGPEFDAMRQEILRHPDVLAVTASNLVPGDILGAASGLQVEGEAEPYVMTNVNVDYDFFETLGIAFVAGRSFSRDRNDRWVEPTPETPLSRGNYIINETAAARLGMTAEQAVGTTVTEYLEQVTFDARVSGEIVGVIEDIYFESLRDEVKPMYFRLTERYGNLGPLPILTQMTVRVVNSDATEAMMHINNQWQRFLPNMPIQQEFLSQKMAALYDAEERQGTVFGWFSAIAVFVAAIGLFGLASFVTEQRRREIGIRKVLGSTVLAVVTLLTREFCRLVLLANLFAWPLAWFFMSGWLQNFAYRVDLGPQAFLLAGGFALLLAIVTVGSLALKAAQKNPVKALRYE